METNLNLQQTIALFLNINESRVTIEPHPTKAGDQAIIQCDTDGEIYDIQQEWCSLSVHFHDQLRYIVIQRGEYKRELPLSLRIWTSGELVRPLDKLP